jgi:hypothetical protein
MVAIFIPTNRFHQQGVTNNPAFGLLMLKKYNMPISVPDFILTPKKNKYILENILFCPGKTLKASK